jgi:hypothetical protein
MVKTAEKLLAPLRKGHSWPDVMVLSWRLSTISPSSPAPRFDGPLDAPPMLDCCWRWAAAASIDHPGLAPDDGVFGAAAEFRQTAPPWLVWRSDREQTARNRATPTASALEPLIQQVVQALGGTFGATPVSEDAAYERAQQIETLNAKLSAPTLQVANSFQIIAQNTEDSSKISPKALASLLGVPAQGLPQRLEQAVADIEANTFLGSKTFTTF